MPKPPEAGPTAYGKYGPTALAMCNIMLADLGSSWRTIRMIFGSDLGFGEIGERAGFPCSGLKSSRVKLILATRALYDEGADSTGLGFRAITRTEL